MNVSELLDEQEIPFKAQGKDYLVLCINPEHDDSSPSMRIDQITGIFQCFSCGFKGSLFQHFGEKPDQGQLRRNLLKRKIADKRAESIGLAFPEGAVPFDRDWRGIRADTYNKFEAFQHHDDRFINRVVFPIRGLSGTIMGFIGRHTDMGTPKYLVSPTSAKLPIYPRPNPIKGCVILVEGIFDVINLFDKGLTNGITAFGTKTITKEKLTLLKMQGVSQVDIFMDNDDAGKLASEKIQEWCEEIGLHSRNIEYGSKDQDAGALNESQVRKLKQALYD